MSTVGGKQAFEEVLQKLKEPQYVAQYLTSFGYNLTQKFTCPNPDHPDKHPSAGLIRGGGRGYCFSCQTSFDIFDLVVWLEGRPSAGAGWVSETVKYLADKFAVPFEMPDLSPTELREMEVIAAYAHAAQIVRHYKPEELSAAVQTALTKLGWFQALRYKMGIGSVISYDEYIRKMTVDYRHDLQFLRECDLADGKCLDGSEHYNASKIFSASSLIYTIRDVDGTVVGFSARNLNYDEQNTAYKLGTLKHQPKKYIHTRDKGKGTNFDKKNVLYNLDLAKKFDGPITVVEGNPDCVSLYGGGNLGTVCTLGTAFTHEHLMMLVALGKKHIIVAMDNDKAGKEGTKRVIEMVQALGGNVGVRLEVVLTPEGVKDPDEFVRAYPNLEAGVDAWRKLERTDLFSWSIKERLEKGEDPFTVCETTMPLVVNEISNVRRNEMCRKLAHLTNTSEDFISREVLRLLDQEEAVLEEERSIVADNLAKKIRQDPKRLESHIAAAATQLESLNKRKTGYNAESVMSTLDYLFDQKEKNVTKCELKTGFPIYDDVFGGIPRYGSFFMFPGKPHHAKSSVLDNLTVGLLENNPELQILFHTIDDSMNDRINRLLGALTGMTSDVFRRPGYYLTDEEGQNLAPENFHERYYSAKAWFRRMHEEERLILVDPSILPGTLECLKTWVSDLRRKFPERTLLVIGDNFHLYSMTTDATGEAQIKAMSKYINEEIVAELRTTAMFTVEIPKEGMRVGQRPSYLNLKGSGSLSFDAKACCGVYNQLVDWNEDPENAVLWWESSEFMETRTNQDGLISRIKIRKPIIEVIVDKNKVSGKKKTIFYRLEDMSGRMVECSPAEQSDCREKLTAQTAEMQSRAKADRPGSNSRAPNRAQLAR